jgi:hypothetical protein
MLKNIAFESQIELGYLGFTSSFSLVRILMDSPLL